MAKRLFDVVGSALILLCLLPLLLLVAAAIAATDGFPVFFHQVRMGLGGGEFRMLKFRSMVKNAASIGPYFTSANDPRITPIGRFVRGTSLDELPQLLNVLRGDMSLVGPRPDVPAQRGLYTDTQWQARCSVRPGITGLAQALVRSDCSEEERLALDLRYVTEQSLWFDLKIMLWTLKRLSGKGGN